MSILTFPSNPTLNQTYSSGSKVWKWNGVSWTLVRAIADDGESAYAIAVRNGFVGTEGEWLNSLKGEAGLFSWVAYADNTTGTSNFSLTYTGQSFIGLALNKTDPDPLTDPTLYAWVPLRIDSVIQGFLTNESHTVAASADGTVSSLAGSGGSFTVFRGTENVSNAATFSVVSETGVDVSINSAGVYTVQSVTSDTGVATFRAVYNSVVIDRVYSITKSRAGAGTEAPVLSVVTSAQAFTFVDGNASPFTQSITINAHRENLPGPIGWSTSPTIPLALSGTDNVNATINVADFGSHRQVLVTATDSISGRTDKITIFRLDRSSAEPGATQNQQFSSAYNPGVVTKSTGGSGANAGFDSDAYSEALINGDFRLVATILNNGGGVSIIAIDDVPATASPGFSGNDYSFVVSPTTIEAHVANTGYTSGSYNEGDVLEIRRVGATWTWYKNNTQVHLVSGSQAPVGLRITQQSAGSIISDIHLFQEGKSKSLSLTARGVCSATGLPGENARNEYLGSIKVFSGGVWTEYATRNVHTGPWVSGYTYSAGDMFSFDGATYIVRIPHLSSGSTPNSSKIEIFSSVGVAGEDALVGFLTNESHVVAADSTGVVGSFTGSGGEFKVFLGQIDATVDCTFSVFSETGVDVTINSSGVYTVSSMSQDSGTAILNAVHASGAVIQKTYSIVKSKAGAVGSPSKLLFVISDRQTISYDSSNVVTPSNQTITFTASRQNTTTPITWTVTTITGVSVDASLYLSDTTGDVVTMTGANFHLARGSSLGVIVIGTIIDGITLSDKISVVKVAAGAPGTSGTDGLVGYLTNENHSVRTDSNGNGGDFSSAGGTFRVVRGVTDITTGNGVIYTVQSESGVDASISSTTGIYTIVSMSSDQGTVVFRANISGTIVDKAYTISKAKDGVDGVSAKTIMLISDRQTIAYDKSGVVLPNQTITLTAQKQNTTATVSWTLSTITGSSRSAATFLSSTTGDSITMSTTNFEGARNGTSGVIITATVTDGTTFSDRISVVKVQDGQDGISPLVGYLTNESHTVSASSSGVVASFTGAGGAFRIFNGLTDITTDPSVTYSVLSETSVDVTINTTTGVYIVDSMSADQGIAILRASWNGYVIDKVYTISKSKSGIDGSDAKLLAVRSSSQAFAYAGSGAANPGGQVVTFTAVKQNTTATVTWTVKDITGAVRTPVTNYLSLATGNSVTMTESQFVSARNGTSGVIVTGTLNDGQVLTDSVSIIRVASGADGTNGTDGTDGINSFTGFLTNESHTVAASSSGVVGSLTSAGGVFKIFDGDTDVTGLVSVTYSVFSETGVDVSIDSTGTYTVSSVSSDTAIATFRAVYNSVTIDKIYTISKSKAGTDGVDAKTLTVSSNRQTITYGGDGLLNPSIQTTTFTTNKQNTTAMVTWTMKRADGTQITASTYLSSVTGDSVTLAAADFDTARGGTSGVTVTASVTDGSTFTDSVSLVKVQSGADGTGSKSGYLTNESQTLAADNSGAVSDFSPATGSFKVFNGTTDVTSEAAFDIPTGGAVNCTGSINASGVYSVTVMSADQATLTVRAQHGPTTLTKVFSLSKSRAGAAGAAAKVITLLSDRQSITYDGAGTAAPSTQTTTFSVIRQNTTNAVVWTITDASGVTRTPTATYLTTISTTSVTMTESQFTAARQSTQGVIVTATVTDGVTLSDSISVVRLSDGAAGLQQAVVTLYVRSSSIPSVPSTLSTYTFATSTLTGHNNSWTQTVPTANGNPLYIIQASAISGSTTDTIATGEWTTPSILNQDGINTAQVLIYKRSATSPSLPSATVTYTFATGGITGLTNGWSSTVPTTDGNPLYVSSAVASSTQTTDTILSGEWATATIVAQDGTSGTSGLSTAIVALYQRAFAAPTVPSNTITWTFSTSAATNINNGWSQNIPAQDSNAYPLWIITASAVSTGSTDTITSGEWASPQKFSQDGYLGLTWTPVLANSDMSRSTNGFRRTISPSSLWNTGVYSLERWTQAKITFVTINTTTSVSVGLNTDPTTDSSYTSIDYGVYLDNTATIYRITNGTLVSLALTYTTGDVFSISHENTDVVLYKNGTPLYTWTGITTAGTAYALDSSFKDVNSEISNITFTQSGAIGLNNAQVLIYKRSAGVPTLPSTTATYTFSTGGITGQNNGWTIAIPATDGNPLYVTAAAAVSTTNTDTIASNEWASPVIVTQDGASGYTTSQVLIYKRSASTPAVPTTTATYNFSTGVLTGQNNLWTIAVPAADGNPLYVTSAIAYANTNTDTIAGNEWSSPVIVNQDGSAGLNQAVVFLYQRSAANASPTVPSTTTTYTFTTSATTGFNNGWSTAVPAQDSLGFPLWVTKASAISNTSTDTIASGEWSTPQIMAQDGMGGLTWTPVLTGTMVRTTDGFKKYNGTALWNAGVYSIEKWSQAKISFKVVNTNTIYSVGLNDDPATDNAYTSINYGAYMLQGALHRNTSGTTVDTGVTYIVGDVITVSHETTSVNLYKNSTLVYTWPGVPATTSLALDSAYFTDGSEVSGLTLSQGGSPGVDSITGYLTNETHTVPAAVDGTVSSYSGASGTFKVFQGATDVTSLFSLSSVANPQVLTVNYTNQTFTVSNGFDIGESIATLTIRATGSAELSTVTVDKVFTLAKSVQGATGNTGTAGANNAQVFLFKRSASAPTNPSTTSTYTFATGVLTGQNNGWTQAVPAADGNSLYVISAVATSNTATDSIINTEWSTAVIQTDAPLNSASVFLYRRSSSVPTVPSVTATYTFSTSVLTGHNNSWTQAVPANDGNPLYVTTAAAVSSTATDTILTGEWAAPQVFASNGTNGTNGTNGSNGSAGLNNAQVFLFKRSASAPTNPSTTSTYTFATGILTGQDNAWTQNVPAANGSPLYVISAVASSNTTTDTIANTEWSTAVIQTDAPLNSAVVFLYKRNATTPAVPTITSTYAFSTAVLTGQDNGWTQAVPAANGNALYVTTASAVSATSTDTILTSEWAAPQIFSQDGATGAAGLNNAQVFLYKRSVSTPALPTTASTYTFASGVLTGQDNGWTQAVPAANGNSLYVTTAVASSNATTDTIANTEWATSVIQTDAPLNSASVYLYQRSASVPSVPGLTTTYTFSTGSLSNINNGWAQTVPVNNGNPLYITQAAAVSSTATDTILTGEWAAPQVLAQDGVTGAAGLNNSQVLIYKRAASLPTRPTTTSTYTFATGVLTGQDNGWTTAIPASDGNPLYVSAAVASSNIATDTIAAAEWSTVVIQTNEAVNSASVYLYQRALSTPTNPSTTSTYTFATGVLTGQNNGWTTAVPVDNGSPLYVITAAAISTTATDTITSGEWSSPQVFVQSGQGGLGYNAVISGVGIIRTVDGFKKQTGSGAWDAQVYSLEKWSQATASLIMNPNSGQMMLALNSDPTTDATNLSLDYAAHLNNGNLFAVKDGTDVTGLGAGVAITTYTNTDVISIAHINNSVVLKKNGVTVYTFAAALQYDTLMALDTSFFTVGTTVSNLMFVESGNPALNSAQVLIYKRSASAPTLPTTTANYTFATGTLTGQNNGWTTTVPATDGTNLYVSSAVASSITASDAIASGEWNAATVAQQDGSNSAQVLIYKRSASVPTLPTTTATYTFATGVLTGQNNGWTTFVPASDGNPLYVSSSVAFGPVATDTIANTEWATSVIQTDAPFNNASVYLYQRSASVPSVPGLTTTYTFSTGVLANTNNGWTQTIPANSGNPLYITQAAAISSTATDTILTSEWSAPQVFSQDGAASAAGLNNSQVLIYKRSVGVPTRPTTTSTYTFATGVLTGQDNGWTIAIPTSDGNPLYVSAAAASSNTPTDSIAAAEWAVPVIAQQDGTAGLNQAVVVLYQRTATQPSVPSVTATYTFATGATTGLDNGWTDTFPDPVNNYPLWVTRAAAISNTATDTILTSEWQTVRQLASDGTGGLTWTPVFSSGMIRTQSGFKKIGATVAWDSQVYSIEKLAQGRITFKVPALISVNVGLNVDPTTDSSYTSIDYGLWLSEDGQANRVINGVPTFLSGFTWAAGDTFSISHEGADIVLYKGATVIYTFSGVTTASQTFALDTSFYSQNGEITNIAFVQAGQSALSAIITNESFAVPADESGNVTSYTGATGSFVIKDGSTDVSSLFTLSTQSNLQALTVNYSSQTYTVTAGLDVGEPYAALLIRATGTGKYVGQTFDKLFTLGKNKQGVTGPLLNISTPVSTFKYIDSVLNPSSQTITVDARVNGTLTSVSWFIINPPDGATIRTPAAGQSAAVTNTDIGSRDAIIVRATYNSTTTEVTLGKSYSLSAGRQTILDSNYTNAQDAIGTLLDIEDGGVLTKKEKKRHLVPLWTDIQSRYTKYSTEATARGVNIASVYTPAYNALNTYLNTTTTLLVVTHATYVASTTLNNKFQDYFTAEQAIITESNAKASQTADWDTGVTSSSGKKPEDNATSGDNLIQNAAMPADSSHWTGASNCTRTAPTATDPGYFWLGTAGLTPSVNINDGAIRPLPAGTKFFTSLWVKGNGSASYAQIVVYFYRNGAFLSSPSSSHFVSAVNTWTFSKGEIAVPMGSDGYTCYLQGQPNNGTQVSFGLPRLGTTENLATYGADWAVNVYGTGKPSDNAGSTLTFTHGGGVVSNYTVQGNKVTQNAAGGWTTWLYSDQSFVGTAMVSGRFTGNLTSGANGPMFGLASPANALLTNYTTTDFGFYFSNGTMYWLEVGGANGSLGVAAAATDVFTLTYDGVNVRWYKNTTLLRTAATTASQTFRAKITLDALSGPTFISDIQFSPYTDNAWSTIGGTGRPSDNATVNRITSSTTAPASPVDGDLWIDTNSPVTIKTRVASAWVAGGNIPTALSQVDSVQNTKLTGIAVGATANIVSSGTLAPRPTGANGDFYYATDTVLLYQKVSGAWVTSANNYTNTNQLTDGALLGQTATWTSVTGTGKPSDNATADLTLANVGSQAVTIRGNGFTRNAGSGDYNACIRSEAYRDAIFAEVDSVPAGGYTIISLDDQVNNSAQAAMDFLLTYQSSTGNYTLYNLGSVLSSGNVGAVSGKLILTYDGIRYRAYGPAGQIGSDFLSQGRVNTFAKWHDYSGVGVSGLRAGIFGANYWNDVGGPGRPETYATSGQNMIPNPGAEDAVIAPWVPINLTGASTFTVSTAQFTSGAKAFLLTKPTTGDTISMVSAARPVVPGTVYSVRVRLKAGAASASGVYIRMWAKATELPNISENNGENYTGNNYSLGYENIATSTAWTLYEALWTCPAGLYWASLTVQNYINGPVSLHVDDAFQAPQIDFASGLGGSTKPENSADVTSAITGVAEIVIQCDHLGVASTGQLTKVTNYKLLRQGTDVTATTTWSRTLLSGTATSTITGGALSISAITTDAVFRLTGVYGGTTRTLDVKVTRILALPPPPSGSGTTQSGGASGTVNSTTAVVIAGPFTINIGSAGQAQLTASSIGFSTTDASPVGTFGLLAQWQEWNGSAWVGLGAENSETLGAIIALDPEFSFYYHEQLGQITTNYTRTGLTANATGLQFRLVGRLPSGTRARYPYNSCSATGS